MAPHSDASGAGCPTTLADLARLTGGSLDGDPDKCVRGMAQLEEADDDQVAFCALPAYRDAVARTSAAAVIVYRDFDMPASATGAPALLRVDNPYLAVAAVVTHFHPEPEAEASVHPSAVVASSSKLAADASIGARTVIGENCEIGAGTRIGPGCVLAADVRIGSDCRLIANVTVYPQTRVGDRVILHGGVVLGADGFGFTYDGSRHVKIPQVGTVEIGDDVEIGANTCVDRAALGVTRVGAGTKIDNLVQIGHNCQIGPDSILCGQVGIGGSTSVGRGVMIGGQAGVGGHLSIGDRVMIAGGSGVTGSVPAGAKVGGYPHAELSRWRRTVVVLKSLPDLARRVRRLESALKDRKEEDE